MFANNETGVIQPIAELAAIAHDAGALFHTDAVQASGKLPLDLSADGPLKHVDLLTLSGHKIYAPKGIGVLFVRKNVRLAPMLHGGTHERQRRAGTENVACIVGLGKAAELATTWLSTEAPAELTALRDRFEQTILTQIEDTGVNGGTRNPRLQHQQPLLRSPRSRSSRHRPRPQGPLRQRRLRLSIRRSRTLPRPHRHGPRPGPSPSQHPFLPLPPHHRRKRSTKPSNSSPPQ